MTELSFLVHLLLEHKLPKPTKEAIAARIKEVEAGVPVYQPRPQAVFQPPPGPPQAPSTLAAMARHAAEGGAPPLFVPPPPEAPAPVAVIAQTPATHQALQHRQESISLALSGKPEKGRSSPRKF